MHPVVVEKHTDVLYEKQAEIEKSVELVNPVLAEKSSFVIDEIEEVKPSQANKIEFLKAAFYVGQVFDTFLIFEHGGKVYLIDQHAAHERINFEKIKKEYELDNIISQVLMMPVVVDFSPNDFAEFCEQKDLFKKLGFDFEQFGGNSIVLRAIPTTLDLAKVSDAVFELMENLKLSKGNKVIFDERALYTIACKMSLKANRKISAQEAKQLISDLSLTENPLTCPHGRPTVLSTDKYEFEKLFKRIT